MSSFHVEEQTEAWCEARCLVPSPFPLVLLSLPSHLKCDLCPSCVVCFALSVRSSSLCCLLLSSSSRPCAAGMLLLFSPWSWQTVGLLTLISTSDHSDQPGAVVPHHCPSYYGLRVITLPYAWKQSLSAAGRFPKCPLHVRKENRGSIQGGKKKEKLSHFNVRLAKFKYLNSLWFINFDIVND